MSKLLASIVIPAHNSAGRLHIPLKALGRQDCVDGAFEVIVVDNNSSDGTAHVAQSHPAVGLLKDRGIDCRVVREDRQGLTHARIRGVLESRSGLVCFLDDDNAPEPNFIAEAVRAFADHSVGMVISRVFPHYTSARPTSSMARREHLLAINCQLGNETIRFGAGPTIAPTVGAGMWIRREVFLSAVPWQNPQLLLSDRSGSQLTSGGDIELGVLIGQAGFQRVYWPELRIQHHLPASRLELRYFCRLIIGTVRSTVTLEIKYAGRRQRFLRSRGLAGLFFALGAVPVLLLRRDGPRESLFVLMSRWARLLGPYRL